MVGFVTFGAGLSVLLLGFLVSKIKPLSSLCLPKAVLGGVCALLILYFFKYFFGFSPSFDEGLKDPFLLAFFASLGLGFSGAISKNLGKKFFIFIGLCAVLMLFQNLLGIAIISAFALPKELGLITGSVSMSGSFGMVAFFSSVFEPHGIKDALDISIACASFGVLFGSLLGAPLGALLIKKHALKNNENKNLPNSRIWQNSRIWDFKNLFISGFLLGFCVLCGFFASKHFGLSAIIFVLIVSLFLRTLCVFFKLKLPVYEINLLGTFCLALFLALAFLNLNISLLLDLAFAMITAIFAQVLFMAVFAGFITFRLLGKDYLAALLASAQCGFGLGAAAIALANVRALSLRFGLNEEALNITCVSSVFVIDFMNVLIIEFFLCFLGGGVFGFAF